MGKSNKTSPITRFINLLKVDKQDIYSIYIFALFNGLIALSLPLGVQAIINLITMQQVSTSFFVLVGIVILGIALTGIIQILQLAVTESFQQKIFTRAAFEFSYRIPRIKLEAVDKAYVPELVNRFFDTVMVQKGLSKILIDFSGASLQIIFGLILLSFYHPFFIAFSLVVAGIVFLIIFLTGPQGLKTSITESKYKYELVHWLEELGRAMPTFKLAGITSLPLDKADKNVTGYLHARKAHFRLLVIQYIAMVVFKVLIAASLLLIGGFLVINQELNIGQFVAAEIIIILILSSVEKLILSMETIYDVLTSIDKIGQVTDIEIERTNPSDIKLKSEDELSVQINNLSYRFEDSTEDILKNVSFSIAAGQKVCISGASGSGKSLLIQFIAGLYEKYTGTITYNKIPLGNWCKETLRYYIGDNLSREDIFKGSLLENITLGKPNINIDEVQKITNAVGLEDFIASLPKGFNTQMLPEGKNLPKSIRIKIMLARCISGSPKMILLEDNFNQLNESEQNHFLDYILEQDRNITVIVISNNINVAKRFDKSLVIEKGNVLAFDTIDNLKNEKWFNQIFQNK
jgi:ABC-type bacteriocin/lantibiotic exporter with double-glycine peptidase domain